MFKINFVSADIRVKENNKVYGFKYKFYNGLNIIKGQNSSGKSSILSCIYYNLGMEQLLGMSTSKNSLLDKCLTSEFKYQKNIYNVTQSRILLEIENDKGNKVLLERMAVSPESLDKNIITVIDNGLEKKYYLHFNYDHTHNRGFYNWLQSFIGIQLPRDKETKKNTLYLQNLFSSCFIEQTKGWSDYLSQMPSFNIKDAKRKLVEYLLSLDCLEYDLEKDKLTVEKNSLVDEWNQAVINFNRADYSLSYKVNGLAIKYEKSKIDSLKNLQLKINIDSEWLDINTATKITNKKLSTLKINNRKAEKRKDLSELSTRRKDLKIRLLNLNRINSSLDRAYTTEDFKVANYKSHLSHLREERMNIVGARKVDDLLSELSESNSCPLCDNSIKINSTDREITPQDYESSLKFIDSKISMIDSYLNSFANYQEEYSKDSNYYNSLIHETKINITNIDRDLNANTEKELSRDSIHAEITQSNLLERLSNLSEQFNIFKEKINQLNTKIINIDTDIKIIKTSFSRDEDSINRFQSDFRRHLSEFHYTSNELYRVNINTKQPYKAFPSVYNASAKSAQPIRLASSASDFIRAEWAFYLALMNKSVVHPGVLIFDEPGQHAMSLDSMEKLLRISEKFKDKQLIFAISKFSKGYDNDKTEQDISLNQLTSKLQDYNEIEIDSDTEKLVSEITL
ncbi:hypothetical protein FR932_03920 [Moritella marina ATCC 15381]|uniref:Uncharacterized protein n=1 Tax=Moritella marina ATCC 15381 TaxID=1202962 RepID=A0A5J6WJQ0_MORMI|nr:hypothetical protein [Moritella marina]QFI37035.1 hypothetical protein FR932_03920 [Moritella marina ATCC 15381]